ncbi:MAG: nuclear transport factor 2 family protein [Bacteroidota bacterium]
MTTEEVANQLVQLCREGKFDQVYQELFSPDIVSVEPEGNPTGTVRGMEALKIKGEKWNEMVEEMMASEISDPIVAADHFSCAWKSKVKFKGMEEIVDVDEISVYKVEGGKIVLEQFFYTPLPELAI